MDVVPVSARLDLAEVMVAIGRDDGTVWTNQHMNAVSLGQIDAVSGETLHLFVADDPVRQASGMDGAPVAECELDQARGDASLLHPQCSVRGWLSIEWWKGEVSSMASPLVQGCHVLSELCARFCGGALFF